MNAVTLLQFTINIFAHRCIICTTSASASGWLYSRDLHFARLSLSTLFHTHYSFMSMFYFFILYVQIFRPCEARNNYTKNHYDLAHKRSSLDVTNIHSSQVTATQIYGTWILMTFTARICCNPDIIPFQLQSCRC